MSEPERSNAVRLGSLTGPQRRLVQALLEAAKAAEAKKARSARLALEAPAVAV